MSARSLDAVHVHPDGRIRELGMSLAELMVSLLILGVFLTVFASGVIALTSSARRQNNLASAEQGARQAFLIMDKQIRYADAVTTPATISGDQWIEWRVPDPTIPVAQSPSQSRCYQWRASGSSGLLQYRSWVVPGSGTVSTPPWTTVTSGLTTTSQAVFTISTAGLAAAPFQLPSNVSTYGLSYVRVGVALSLSVGTPPGRASSSTLFSALNATSSAASAVCTEVPRT